MTLQELLAVIAGVVWALLWQPVGRLFEWWSGAGAFIGGGLVGLVIGWLLCEWISRLRPHRNWVRTLAALTSVMLAWLACAALPLWVRWLLREG